MLRPGIAPGDGGQTRPPATGARRRRIAAMGLILIAALGAPVSRAMPATGPVQSDPRGTADRQIADRLAALLRAGRAVISEAQPIINAPSGNRDRLTGQIVLARVLKIFQRETGLDPRSLPPRSREARLLNAEMQAIRAVVDSNQGSINAPDLGFKGFIPAVFSRLVSEEFSRRAAGLAEMKVTAPAELVRNRKARPDAWETQVIDNYLRQAAWPAGQAYQAVSDEGGRLVYRIAVPEYYTPSCLSCHGGPKGSLDVTGYPMEGAADGALGGVISIKIGRL